MSTKARMKMKNSIYLIIIAALFSGCMGNSFRTQRYTNFTHASKHSTVEQQVLTKEHVTSKHRPVNVPENTNPVTCSVAIENQGAVVPVKVYHKHTGTKNMFAKPVIKELVKEENKPVQVKHNKALNKKELSAKGVIGTALRIVLLAVVLAIVIGVIILVVLL